MFVSDKSMLRFKDELPRFYTKESLMTLINSRWINASFVAKTYSVEGYSRDPLNWILDPDVLLYSLFLSNALDLSSIDEFNDLKDKLKITSNVLLSSSFYDTIPPTYFSDYLSVVNDTKLICIRPGEVDEGGGIWIHPSLSTLLQRWVDIDSAVWSDLESQEDSDEDVNSVCDEEVCYKKPSCKPSCNSGYTLGKKASLSCSKNGIDFSMFQSS